MLIFLFGQDTFRSTMKLRELTSQYQKLHKESIHVKILDCAEAVFSSFKTELETQSLFRLKKLVILKNLFSQPEWKERIEELKEPLLKTDDIIVFFEPGKVAAKEPLARFLQEHAKTQEFAPLNPAPTKTWIAKEFSALGVKVEEGVAQMLFAACGNNLWLLFQEIQKLAAFSKSKHSELQKADAAQFLQEPIEADIFQTLSLLQQGSRARALEKLEQHLAKGESPFFLLSMFSWWARSRAQDPQSAHEKVFKTDLAMKTGRDNPAQALFSLALSLP